MTLFIFKPKISNVKYRQKHETSAIMLISDNSSTSGDFSLKRDTKIERTRRNRQNIKKYSILLK
jgi:hypothetical protein